MNELVKYVIRGVPLKLFSSYLSNIKQVVRIGSILSPSKEITHGVPQGSVLAPLLFFIYVLISEYF